MGWANVWLFYALTALSCGYALLRGGAPERVAALIVLAGIGLSAASVSFGFHRYAALELDIFAQDLAMFVALYALALAADRFWPIWIAGFQLATVLVHVTRALAPDMFPLAYAAGIRAWAYLVVAGVGVGTVRHRRRRRAHGPEHGWTADRIRAGRLPA